MFTIQTPANSEDNLVYTNMSAEKGVTDKQLLKGRKHISQSIMVAAAVSKLGKCPSFSSYVSKIKQCIIVKMSLKGLSPQRYHFSTRWGASTSLTSHHWTVKPALSSCTGVH